MSELTILKALAAAGMTPIGACAMGGNIQAESGFKSDIAQRGMTKLSDEEYTAAVDEGTIGFSNDGVGYGLCQWTYKTRKGNLLEYAIKQRKSVGDEELQVQFCLLELKNEYPILWEYLKTATDLYDATERICKEYERPAVNNIDARASYAGRLYKDYGETIAAGASPRPTEGNADRKPESCIMGVVRYGEHTPEACFLMAKLEEIGYNVLWDGLYPCIVDFQQKTGLAVDGVCGEKTWKRLMQN